MKAPITVGQVGQQKRRAIYVLFMSGMSFLEVARIFRLPKRVAEECVRRHSRNRWRTR